MKTYEKKGKNGIYVYNIKFAYSYAKFKNSRAKPAETRKRSKTILER